MAGTFKDELRIEEFEIKEETISTAREKYFCPLL